MIFVKCNSKLERGNVILRLSSAISEQENKDKCSQIDKNMPLIKDSNIRHSKTPLSLRNAC